MTTTDLRQSPASHPAQVRTDSRERTIPPPDPAVGPGAALTRVIRAELIKSRSLRSTVAALVTAWFLVVVLAVVMAVGAIVQGTGPDGVGDAPVGDLPAAATAGISPALYAVLTFGIIAVTGEYATGTIRSTTTAVPRRGLLVAGKAVAVAVLTFATTLTAMLTAFLAVAAILSTTDTPITVAGAVSVRVVVGGALYLTVVALIGSGFGWLLRSTAGAVAAAVGLIVLVPVLALVLPPHAAAVVQPYLPDAAGTAIYTAAPELISPWAGYTVFCAYATVVLLAGAMTVRRRDV